MKATPEGIAILMRQLEDLALSPASPDIPPRPPLPPEREDDNGGDMDIWQQSVETRLGELSSRILWLAGGLAIGFVTLLGIMLTRTDGLGDRLAKVEATVERLDERTAAIQKQQDGMDTKLDKLLAK